jgi:ring-1,2-phenylacetyl-CoA epoxidase subunit PaaC
MNITENKDALRDLLYKMGDDALIIGHRNSEWVGIGPILEEDIAFASIAQDKIGHAQALYSICHDHLDDADPDTIGFMRNEKQFKCSHFVELPIGGFDFSVTRQFLFDSAEFLRYSSLKDSSFTPLAQLARKVTGEIKYHVYHGNTWMTQLGKGTEESKARMQVALNESMPYALGIFEKSDYEDELINTNVFIGETNLQEQWLDLISDIIAKSELTLPNISDISPVLGGRKGYHTEHLQPMLDEMTEVYQIDPSAEW